MTFIRKNKQSSLINNQNSNTIVQENIIRQIKQQTYDHRMMDYSMEDR